MEDHQISLTGGDAALNCDQTVSAPQAAALVAQQIDLTRGDWRLEVEQLRFDRGSWISIVGANGAGKSTLLLILAGLVPGAKHRLLLGRPAYDWTPQQAAQRLAWCGLEIPMLDDLRVRDVVALGRLPWRRGWFSQSTRSASAEDAMRQLGVFELADRAFSTLSSGQRQLTLLARLFAVDAQVLLLDEPLVNLDPVHQQRVLTLCRDQANAGKTVISVLHDLTAALRGDQLLILKAGRLQYYGLTSDQRCHSALESAFDNAIEVVRADWRQLVVHRS